MRNASIENLIVLLHMDRLLTKHRQFRTLYSLPSLGNLELYILYLGQSMLSLLYPEQTNLGWRCTRLWTWADYSYEVQWAAQVRSPCRRCWKALAQSFKILPIISSPSSLDQNFFNRGGGPLTMGESRRPLGAQNTCIPSVPNYKSILLLYSIHSKL